ncbi:MAG: NnrS family protein [Deltaproteobacteria bacterium]|nr:NnrS family protein [Deltaproteobacteria bacterium]
MKAAYIRWMIKSALLCLALGITLGALMMLGYRIPELAWALQWRSVHVHLLLVGTVMQMIIGVALWMFPRPPGNQWPSDRAGWTLFALLNGGILLRSLFHPWINEPLFFWLTAIGGIGQALACWLFLWLILKRVRGPRME